MADRETTEPVTRDCSANAVDSRSVEDRLLDVHANNSDTYDGPVAEVVEIIDEVTEEGTVTVRFRLPSGHVDEEELLWPASPDVDAKLNYLIDNDRLPFDEQSFSTEKLYGADIPVEQVDDRGNHWKIRVPDDSLTKRLDFLPSIGGTDIELPTSPSISDDGYIAFGWTALGMAMVGLAGGVVLDVLTVPALSGLLALLYVGSGAITRRAPDIELKVITNVLAGMLGLILQWEFVGAWAETGVNFIGISAVLTVLWLGCAVLHHRISLDPRHR